MRNFLFIFTLSIVSFSVFAQEENYFAQANELYANNKYTEAALLYEEILTNEGESAELYYNLGNVYYKTNEIAKSIINYERALRLKPFYRDAKYNLQLANNRVIDREEKQQKFFINSWINSLMNLLSENIWSWISIGFFIISLGFFFMFAFGRRLSVRKIGFRLSVIVFLFCLTTGIFAEILHKKAIDRADAIVMTGIVTIKSSPDDHGTELFVLHEGSKVTIKETLGEWCEIQFGANNHIGWLKIENLERI